MDRICYCLVFVLIHTSYTVHKVYSHQFIPLNRLSPVSKWMQENISEGEVVVNASINSFPELLFHNPTYSYLVGMDWNYLQYHRPEMAKNYYNFVKGEFSSFQFMKKYNFRFLFIDKKYRYHALLNRCIDSANFMIIYNDMNCMVLRTIDVY